MASINSQYPGSSSKCMIHYHQLATTVRQLSHCIRPRLRQTIGLQNIGHGVWGKGLTSLNRSQTHEYQKEYAARGHTLISERLAR